MLKYFYFLEFKRSNFNYKRMAGACKVFHGVKECCSLYLAYIFQEWTDHKFMWDPGEYGGVTELYVPSEHIWLPDIVLYNK